MLMGVKFLHQITENRFNKVTEPEKNIAQSQIRTQNSLTDVESNCRVTGYFLQSCVEITFRLLKKDGLHTTFEAVDISLMTCLLALYCLNWEKFTESLAYDVFLGTSEDGSFMEIFRQIHVGRPREHRSSANSLMFSIFAELLQQLTEVSPEIMGILTKFCVKVELLSPPLQDFLHYGFSSKRLPTAGIDDWQHMLLTFMTLLAAKLQVVPEWLKATNPRNVLLKKTVAIVKKMRVNPTDRLSQMLLLCWHAVEPNFTPFNGFWEIDFSSIIRGLHGDIKTLNEGPLALNLCLIALVFEQKTFQLKMDFNLIRFNGYPIHLDLSGRLDTELEELMTLLCRVIHRNHQDPVAGAISLEALMRVIYWAVVAGRLRLLKGFVQWNPELIELLLPAVQAGQEKMFAYFAHFTGYKFVILVKEVIDRLFPRESPFGSALSGHLCKLLNRQFYEADVGGKIWAAWEAFWRSHL